MNGVQLIVRPSDPPVSWATFCADSPPFSVALDGYVHGGPRFDPTGPRTNFNHHEDVDRLATRATCAQVHLAIRQGFFDRFRGIEGPRAFVFVNDCDQDVCTACYLLTHHYRGEHTMNPTLNRLVALEDMLDTTAGAYPLPIDLPALGELAWVFEPYSQARLAGELARRDQARFASIIEDVAGRIDRHVVGQGKSLAIDVRYKTLRRESGWVMVREIGAQARTAMFAHGIRAFASVRERADGRWDHVIGRMSQFTPFDLPAILARVNAIDGTERAADCWGGGDNTIGSPRIAGSGIDPDALADAILATT